MSLGLQLKLLGLNVYVLIMIAANVVYVNYVVRFRSGLDDTNTLRRYWSKAEQRVMAPERFPFFSSILYGLGLNSLVRSILTGVLHLVDGNHLKLSGEYVVSCASTVAGALCGTALYKFDGGSQVAVHSGVLALLAVPTGVLKLMFKHHDATKTTWALWIVSIVVLSLLATGLVLRMITFRKVSAGTRDPFERGDAGMSDGVKSKFGLSGLLCIASLQLLFCVHVIISALLGHYVHKNDYTSQYLAVLLLNFCGLMPLISFSSVVITSEGLYKFSSRADRHWRTGTLILSFAMFMVQMSLMTLYRWAVDSKINLHFFTVEVLRVMFVYFAVGLISLTAYYAVCLRATKKALDTGVEGESELILDDEDYEEYNI